MKNEKVNTKILHISRNFLPTIGGIQECIYQISKGSTENGYLCRVIALDYNFSNRSQRFKKYENIDGIDVFRVQGMGHYKKPIPLRIPLNIFKWADIIHLHDPRFLYETSLLLKRCMNYKLVLSSHGFLFHTRQLNWIKDILIPIYYRPTIERYFDWIICDSKQDYSYFNKWNTKKLELIENGIDFDFYNKTKKNPKPGKFLYYGRIETNKGIDLLFSILALLKEFNWSIDIIGDGRPKLVEDLVSLAKKLDIIDRISFRGFLSKDELSTAISRAEFCFFPSTYEGFGLSLLEAMASGTVCIANNISTYRTFLENNVNGFIIDYKNIEKASKELQKIFKINPVILKKISNNARLKAKGYDWKNKIKLYDKVYKKIIG